MNCRAGCHQTDTRVNDDSGRGAGPPESSFTRDHFSGLIWDFYMYKSLLFDKQKLISLGVKAQERALKDFNWDVVAKNYIDAF